MLRQSFILTASDSPFRYTKVVRVSPHIRKKSFGEEVLLFATPARLSKQAEQVLDRESKTGFTPAFWEVFAKRTNESVHLLSLTEVSKIISAFERKAHRPDLLAGMCHLLIQKLDNAHPLESAFQRLEELVSMTRLIAGSGLKISDRAYTHIIAAFADLCRDLSREDVLKIAEVVQRLREERRDISSIDQVLIRRMIKSLKLDGDSKSTFASVFHELDIDRN